MIYETLTDVVGLNIQKTESTDTSYLRKKKAALSFEIRWQHLQQQTAR